MTGYGKTRGRRVTLGAPLPLHSPLHAPTVASPNHHNGATSRSPKAPPILTPLGTRTASPISTPPSPRSSWSPSTSTATSMQRVAIQRSNSLGASNAGGQNIQVVCRFRPARETDPISWFEASEGKSSIKIRLGEKQMDFNFDRVWGGQCTQSDVYGSISHLIQGVIQGFNGTLFTYGQTSSGKTHTMMGKTDQPEEAGIIPRAMEDLFSMVAESEETVEFTFRCQYVEIYCEKIKDLLDPENDNLKIREDKIEGIVIAGATEVYVTSCDEVLKVLDMGQALRATSATRMNAESSRSHALLLLSVTQKDTSTGHIKKGRLVLTDLAGSERISKTGAEGLRLEEAKNINRSLTSLGMVIKALSEGQSHAPFRDSKLTRILEESLGGNSRTCLIICCSPELIHSQETISTLRFGERAKRIKNRAVVNEELSAYELRTLLEKAQEEIRQLRGQLLLALEGKIEGLDLSSLFPLPPSPLPPPPPPPPQAAPFSERPSAMIGTIESKVIPGSPSAQINSIIWGQEEKYKAQEAQLALEIELGDLRALLATREKKNAHLKFEKEDLIIRSAEEESAVALALVEQQALEARTREAEAQMDQMMRALADAHPPQYHLHPPLRYEQPAASEEGPRQHLHRPHLRPEGVVAKDDEEEEEEEEGEISNLQQDDESISPEAPSPSRPHPPLHLSSLSSPGLADEESHENVDKQQHPSSSSAVPIDSIASPLSGVVLEDDYIDRHRQNMTPERELTESGGGVQEDSLRFAAAEDVACVTPSPTQSNGEEDHYQQAGPNSPDLRQVYEEKLISVEKVVQFLQDELADQRDAYEQVITKKNEAFRALLNQNAQLAMQKDVQLRHIFSLEIKIDELETAAKALRRAVAGEAPDLAPRERRFTGFFTRSGSTVKSITGGKK